VVLDSADPDAGTSERPSEYLAAGAVIEVTNRSFLLLRKTERAPTPVHPTAKRTKRATLS
jgi:hypothetical protein